MADKSQREEDLFNEALALGTPAERQAFLRGACGEDQELRQGVEALLAAYLAGQGFIPTRLASEGTMCEETAPREGPGTVVGRYKLLEQIGEGGCGVVYVAEQEEPVRRRVALKVIKLGMDTRSVIARFEAERQALAMMDHPNIAKVLDAGATEMGRPYFVMELVRGIKITDYCDQNNLSTSERLELFIQVCHAIQHAHQKGIIHRDIKPSNILVTLHDGAPVPKVIDFGIAKATAQQPLTDKTVYTAFEQFVGTPAYMSPEQAEMSGLDVDTRSDVYALGVLLYELLSGKTPFDPSTLMAAGLVEMRRIIREQEPVRPSTRLSTLVEGELTNTAKHRRAEPPKLIHLLRGDLDWIVMKCLEKDRTRRYETANGLAADIGRYLSHEPVGARSPSVGYKVQKFVRRNKVMVGAASAVAGVLILGIVVSALLAIRARQAEANERHQSQLAQQKAIEALQAQTHEAEQRKVAQQAERAAREQAYAANINLAYQAWRESNVGRVRRLLAQARPKSWEVKDDPLGWWEWRYLWGLAHGNELCEAARFKGGVWQIACAGDGKSVAIGLIGMAAEERGGYLYDLASGGLSNQRQFATNSLSGAVFLPGSDRLLSNKPDDHGLPGISVLDAATLREVARLQTSNEVRMMRVSRDGRWLASLEKLPRPDPGSSLRLWRTEDWSQVWDKRVDASEPNDGGRIEFLKSDSRVAVGSGEGRKGKVTIFETATGTLVREFTTHPGGNSDEITALAYVPAVDLLAVGAGYNNSKITLWNPNTGERVRELTNHQAHIPDLAVSPDGHWLASASADQSVRLWDISSLDPKDWTNRYVLRGHEDELECVTFSADGKRLLTGDREGSVRLWQVPPAESRLEPLLVAEDCGLVLRVSPDSRRIATFSFGGECLIWDMDTGKKLETLRPPGGNLQVCQFSQDGKQLLVGGPGSKLRVWDFGLKSWGEFDIGRSNADYTWPLFYVPDTNLFWLQQATKAGIQFSLWQFDQRRLVREFAAPNKGFHSCNFSSRGDLVVWHWDGSLTFQKTTPPFARTNFWPHRRGVQDVAFTPDGSLFATAGDDGVAKFWEADTCHEILPARKGHLLSTVQALDISPDGRRLVTTGAGRTAVKIWDIQTHQEWISLDSEGLRMRWILFSPDGNKLVGLNARNHLHIWRAPSWEEITAAEAKEKAQGRQL